MAAFLRANNLVRFLQARDWASFARACNGPAFARNKYDVRLTGAYQLYASGALPDIEVRRAQLYLAYLGFAPGVIDGLHGKRSRSAVAKFLEDNALGSGDRVDKAVLDAMQARVAAL